MHMNQSELEDLWQRQYGGMSEKGARQLECDITWGYKVGDLVRVTHLKHTFEKGFMPRWQREVFKVVGSKYMKKRLVYKLQDLKGPTKGPTKSMWAGGVPYISVKRLRPSDVI